MSSIVLTITDESLLSQIKKACALLKGVGEVKVLKSASSQRDITQTSGYKEAMEDIRLGHIYHAKNTEDMFQQILGNV